MAKKLDLNSYTLEELRHLRDQATAIINYKSIAAVTVGECYQFMSKKGEMITLLAERINQKSVSGTQMKDGKPTAFRWKVAASLLKPLP